MRIGLACHFAQFVDDVRRRRQVWIAHAQIDDVLARRSRFRPHRIDFGDDIRGQALDAIEFVGHGFFRFEEFQPLVDLSPLGNDGHGLVR
jgi:hypothetical protein